jgi:hypothetical protein
MLGYTILRHSNLPSDGNQVLKGEYDEKCAALGWQDVVGSLRIQRMNSV